MQNRKRDIDVQNRLLDSVGEGEGGMFRENSIETCVLSRVKQITSPDWMHETSARTWCTGKTQGERVEREVGGGIRMGNTCKPMAVSFQCMTKFTTNKKKIIFRLKNTASLKIYTYKDSKSVKFKKRKQALHANTNQKDPNKRKVQWLYSQQKIYSFYKEENFIMMRLLSLST